MDFLKLKTEILLTVTYYTYAWCKTCVQNNLCVIIIFFVVSEFGAEKNNTLIDKIPETIML